MNDNDSRIDESDSSSDNDSKKHAAKKNIDSNSNHLDSESSDPGDKKRETKNTRSRIKNACKAMVQVSIASVWPEQNTKVGEAI